MKLFFCTQCQDVVKITTERRSCQCGVSWGVCKDDKLHAQIGGKAIPLGFNNPSLINAANRQPKTGKVLVFEAFVIAKNCGTVEEVKNKPRKIRTVEDANNEIIMALLDSV